MPRVCNCWYPVVDEKAVLLEPRANVSSRDGEAEKGIENFASFEKPEKGFSEQVYFHDIEADGDGNGNIAIVNEAFSNGNGIGIWLKYNKDNLPYLIQWKQMGMGEYVCGIEPGNSYPRGRSIEKKEGTFRYIEPGQKVNFWLEFNILKSAEDIENFKKAYI